MGDENSGLAGGNSSDRRRSERVPARVEIRFDDTSQAARALRAYSLNLSVGGLCFRSGRQYEIGTPLKLSLSAGGELFELHSVVAWTRAGAVGLRFENVPPEIQERLQSLVDALKASPRS